MSRYFYLKPLRLTNNYFNYILPAYPPKKDVTFRKSVQTEQGGSMVVKKLSKVVCLALSTVILSALAFPSTSSARTRTTEYMGYSANSKAQSTENTDVINVEYNGYSFDVPEYWGEPIVVDNEMYFIKENGTLPLLYMTYASKDYYTENYKNSILKYRDYINILEESLDDFISYVFTSPDFDDSTKTYIAGNPAITRTGTCTIYGKNDAFVAQFIDDENIYVFMMVDYENSGSAIFDDIDGILDSFTVIE